MTSKVLTIILLKIVDLVSTKFSGHWSVLVQCCKTSQEEGRERHFVFNIGVIFWNVKPWQWSSSSLQCHELQEESLQQWLQKGYYTHCRYSFHIPKTTSCWCVNWTQKRNRQKHKQELKLTPFPLLFETYWCGLWYASTICLTQKKVSMIVDNVVRAAEYLYFLWLCITCKTEILSRRQN